MKSIVTAATMSTHPNRGKLGYYLAVRATPDTPEQKQQLEAEFKNRGYSSFKGAFTKLIKTPEELAAAKTELETLGQMFGHQVDMAGLDLISSRLAPAQTPLNVTPDGANTAVVTDTAVPTGQNPSDQLQNMADKLKDEIKSTSGAEQADLIAKKIADYLDKLANSVDETSKQQFVKDFLSFSAKFWKYSFVNQMLIWMQTRGTATNVAGYRKWQELGRQVQAGAKSIAIFAPMAKKIKDKNGEEKSQVYGFRAVSVFDYSDTKPMEGDALAKWQAKNPGSQPFDRDVASVHTGTDNEETAKTQAIQTALMEFAASNNIEVNLSEDTGAAGGYSAGGEISIHYNTKGAERLSVLVHEIAHELLHWAARKGSDEQKAQMRQTTRQEREIDAESVAYIVMQHLGFAASGAPKYLALWEATAQDIKKRRETISKAAKAIIEGISKNMNAQPDQMPDESTVAWVQKNCKFAQNRLPFEQNPPVKSVPQQKPLNLRPNPTKKPLPNMIDLHSKDRNQYYDQVAQQQPMTTPQEPTWAMNLDPKTRMLYDKYKSTGNVKGLQMLQQQHQTFAQVRPQRRLLSPQESQPLYQQIAQTLKGSAQQDPDPTANFNAVKKQVTMSLQSALAQRGVALQNLQDAVNEIMTMMGVQPPAPAPMPQAKPQQVQQGPHGWEPPGMAQMRNQGK